MIDPKIIDFATPLQARYIKATIDAGSARKAATVLGVHPSRVTEAYRKAKNNAALSGYAPDADMTHPTVEPFIIKGTSTLYGEDGQVKQQWVKTQVDKNALVERVQEALAGLSESVRGLADPIIPPPHRPETDLMTVYPMGDPHFGMYAWAAEAGEDFDLDIAERATCGAIDRLARSGHGETGLLINLGDFFHADDSRNETPGHGNKLDVDTRYGKVLQAGMRTMVYCIKRLLTVHNKVIVWNMPGNHDPHAAWALAIGLQAYFEREPRVQIDLPTNAYNYMRFGKNLIGAHHGDGAKAQDLPLVMAWDRKEDWGLTDHRVWHCGHIHHLTRKEYPGVVVETHRTLASRDAWHAMKGYRAGRDMNAIVYHYNFGEIQRTRCDFSMVQQVVLDVAA